MEKKDQACVPGATLERGRVLSGDGTGYIVESLDRGGLTSPPIRAITEETLTEGDMVYFFLFRDGTGIILHKAE